MCLLEIVKQTQLSIFTHVKISYIQMKYHKQLQNLTSQYIQNVTIHTITTSLNKNQ
jgi:hypothetical protein